MREHSAYGAAMQAAYACRMSDDSTPSLRRQRRQQKLNVLLKLKGGPTKVAADVGTPRSHLSAMSLGTRGVGDQIAAKLEAYYKLPSGWFDQVETQSWPFSIAIDRFLMLKPADRDFVEQRLEEAIVLCEFRLTQMADLSEQAFQKPPVIATTAPPVRKNRDRLIDLTGTEAKRGSTGSKAFGLSKSGRRRDPK